MVGLKRWGRSTRTVARVATRLAVDQPTDKLFTGHQKEGPLYFMQARFYDPLLGRFLSADTIVPEPGNPQSLNRYSYVYNSPLMYNDPTGHQGGFGGNLGVGFCMDIDCTSDPNIIAAVESACHADYASCMPFVEYLPPISKPPPPDPADYEIFGSYQAYFDDWQRSVEAYLGPHPGPNVEALRMVGEVLIGLTPLDTPCSIAGVLAGRSCTGGSASRAWSALGLLPFVSGSLDDVADVARAGRAARAAEEGLGNISGGVATIGQALRGAEQWLGPGHREIAPGVFRSADNQRQFRITTSDFPQYGTHVHFESIGPDGRQIVENSHVVIIE